MERQQVLFRRPHDMLLTILTVLFVLSLAVYGSRARIFGQAQAPYLGAVSERWLAEHNAEPLR